MRAEKQLLTKEYVSRLNSSPYIIAVDYTGLKVGPMTELRKRLVAVGAEIHIVKNSVFRIAVTESGVGDVTGLMVGQMAAVTGKKDISATAKVLKTFSSEFDKPKIKFGYLNNQKLEARDLIALADLPSIEVLRSKFMGVLQAPATKLVVLLNTPATQLVRVLKAKAEKVEKTEAEAAPAPAPAA